EEAGGKCANPGCDAYRIHIHHIQEWHAYRAHDQEHMIAICPNCHDAVHRGALRIEDETLYRWKEILRETEVPRREVLFIESGPPPPKLLLGDITVYGDSGLIIFDLAPGRRLGFRVEDSGVQLVGLVVTSLDDQVLLRVIDNRVTHAPAKGVE